MKKALKSLENQKEWKRIIQVCFSLSFNEKLMKKGLKSLSFNDKDKIKGKMNTT